MDPPPREANTDSRSDDRQQLHESADVGAFGPGAYDGKTKYVGAAAHAAHAKGDAALYIHGKAIVADAGRPSRQVPVGSQNFSVASPDYHRELGILTTDPAVVAAIAATLSGDYAGAALGARPPPASTP